MVMGMGEPLANLDRLLAALAMATAPDGLGISARRMTISTVGLPAGIRRLAEQNCQYHLAVSLHAADDELRNRLVPTNRKRGHRRDPGGGRRVFRQDRPSRDFRVRAPGRRQRSARATPGQLLALLKGRPALVNLIPYNPVAGLPFRTPSPRAVARFVEILDQGGVNAVVRHRKGNRIDAACGQLRPACGSPPAAESPGGLARAKPRRCRGCRLK